MAVEPDAGQVIHLALVPIRCLPQRRDGMYLGQFADLVVLPARQDQFHHETMLVNKTREVINDLDVRLKAGLWSLLGIELQVIDTANTVQRVETKPRVVAQES